MSDTSVQPDPSLHLVFHPASVSLGKWGFLPAWWYQGHRTSCVALPPLSNQHSWEDTAKLLMNQTGKSQNVTNSTFVWSRKSEGQPRFKDKGTRFYLLMQEAACVSKGEGRVNGKHLWRQAAPGPNRIGLWTGFILELPL